MEVRSKHEVVEGLLTEYRGLVTLMGELTAEDWRRPTRCDGWEVGDVCGHVVGLAVDSFGGQVGRFTPDEQASQRRGRGPAAVAAELVSALEVAEPRLRSLSDVQWLGSSGAAGLTVADGIETLWYDAWVHRDDVSAAIGGAADDGPGLDVAVAYLRRRLAQQGWSAPPGVDPDALDRREFVLAATGRGDPVALGLGEDVNIYR